VSHSLRRDLEYAEEYEEAYGEAEEAGYNEGYDKGAGTQAGLARGGAASAAAPPVPQSKRLTIKPAPSRCGWAETVVCWEWLEGS
jgi:hypothetical protein